MADPKPTHRPTTVAIVDKTSGEILSFEELDGAGYPYGLVSDFFDRFADEVVQQMKAGEERYYLLFSRSKGLRPDVREVGIINKIRTVERSVMGSKEPGFIETFPFRVDWGKAQIVKKGGFPQPPGSDSSVEIDDGGIDEDAIRAAAIITHSQIRSAVSAKFDEESRFALLGGLKDLMISTGTEGEPSEFWYHGQSIEETAVDLYDAAIVLWLESDAAATLPEALKAGYKQRMLDDSERTEEIVKLARHIALHGLFD